MSYKSFMPWVKRHVVDWEDKTRGRSSWASRTTRRCQRCRSTPSLVVRVCDWAYLSERLVVHVRLGWILWRLNDRSSGGFYFKKTAAAHVLLLRFSSSSPHFSLSPHSLSPESLPLSSLHLPRRSEGSPEVSGTFSLLFYFMFFMHFY